MTMKKSQTSLREDRFMWQKEDLHRAESKTCWDCRWLLSEKGALPPVLCKAYPEGEGVSIEILSGQVVHDHVLAGQRLGFVFETSDGQSLAKA